MTLIHTFSGAIDDGADPQYGTLSINGSTMYGMTMGGGSNNLGAIFKVDTNGGNFSLMHSFTGSTGHSENTDGRAPQSGLTLIGSNLYGTAVFGGTSGQGNVFKIGADGNAFTVLHSFTASDGAFPYGDLTPSGSILYGATFGGGSGNRGTIFKINMETNEYTYTQPFSSNNYGPLGGLTLCGSTLYGTNTYGTSNSKLGSIFKINTDLTGFEIIHPFTGTTEDGAFPYENTLTLCGSTLYGITRSGGGYGSGTIYKMNLDGSGFTILHSFEKYTAPKGDLTLIGSTLYGVTSGGGGGSMGTIYKIDTSGDNYSIIHSFNNSDGMGILPIGGLTLNGSTLYGMTMWGGQYNHGTIYALAIPEPSILTLLVAGTLTALAFGWRKIRRTA